MIHKSESTCRLVLKVTPEVYERIRGRALEHSLDVEEWATRQIITASMPRPISKRERERRSHEAGFKLLAILAGHPVDEKSSSSICPHPRSSAVTPSSSPIERAFHA